MFLLKSGRHARHVENEMVLSLQAFIELTQVTQNIGKVCQGPRPLFIFKLWQMTATIVKPGFHLGIQKGTGCLVVASNVLHFLGRRGP